jgi:hypothetical protein
MVNQETIDIEMGEHHLEQSIQGSGFVETEYQSLIAARRGAGTLQGDRRKGCCHATNVERLEHLSVSHSMPWRRLNNDERLIGENITTSVTV